MKKFLTFVLVLAMVMSVSSVAFAAGGDGSEATPWLVGTELELRNAIAAGGYIKLTADITTSEKLEITKDVIIDGSKGTGGVYTINYTGSDDRAIDIPNNSGKVNVTIKDLKVIGNAQRGINYNDDGKLTLENVQVGDFGTLFTYALNLPGNANNCEVTIKGGYYTGCIALNVWGENSIINVEDAKLTSVDDSAAEGYSAVMLNDDGSVSADGTVVNITRGSITIIGDHPGDSSPIGNATNSAQINLTDVGSLTGDDIVKFVASVKHGDNAYLYTSLQDAVDSSATLDNAEITVLTDDVDVSSIQTNKNLTIKTKDGKEYVTKNGEVGVDAGNGIFVTPPELKFDTVKVGYTQPAGKVIKVTGIDSGFSVTFTVSGNYEISADGTNYSKNSVQGNVANDSAQVYVRPILDLGDGAYAGNVDVSIVPPSGPSAAPEPPEVALSFKVDPAPSSGGGYYGPDVWYIGGNTFGTNTNQVPTSVEIDQVPVSFTMNGSQITVDCIQPGSGWVTVRWGSVSNYKSFTPDANAYCTQTVIPKTGGMSIWAAIAQFLGF